MVDALTLDGIPDAELASRWGAPAVHHHERLGSSLDAVHAHAAAGAAPGTVVLCDEQTAGRGREGRAWHSPPGGVWLAVLLRPPLAAPGAVSIRAGIAVADAVDGLLGAVRAELKWPNDVYLDGRKLAGVLCEGRWAGTRLQWMAVGIGVNVRNRVPPALGAQAITLGELLPSVRRLDLLDRLAPALTRLAVGGEPLTASECSIFERRHAWQGRLLRAPVPGRVAGVAADGALLVATPRGTIAVREGRVEPA